MRPPRSRRALRFAVPADALRSGLRRAAEIGGRAAGVAAAGPGVTRATPGDRAGRLHALPILTDLIPDNGAPARDLARTAMVRVRLEVEAIGARDTARGAVA